MTPNNNLLFGVRTGNTPGLSLQLHCDTFLQLDFCADAGPPSTTFTYTSVTSGFRQDGHVFRGHSDLAQLCDSGPSNYSSKCTQCVSGSACDREPLFNVIVHLGNPGACDIVQLLDVTSVSSGAPGVMGPTLSSTYKQNHHESVDQPSDVFSCFRSTSLVNKLFLIYLFKWINLLQTTQASDVLMMSSAYR